jgi:hypothetical protein
MRRTGWGILASCLLCFSGCATRYAYRFDLERPDEAGDVDAVAQASADPTGSRLILLTVTNRTAVPLAVDWTKISVVGPEGRARSLRPDADLGWVPAGATQTARLSPFALPEYGDEALANEGARFVLEVPMRPNGERKVYRVHLGAHVARMEEKQ